MDIWVFCCSLCGDAFSAYIFFDPIPVGKQVIFGEYVGDKFCNCFRLIFFLPEHGGMQVISGVYVVYNFYLWYRFFGTG